MDILSLYQDYSISYQTEGHKHCRPGFVNTPCPFCISGMGHEGLHLSFNFEHNYFVCWRCGWHSVSSTIARLINIPEKEVNEVIKKYGLIIKKFNDPIKSKTQTRQHKFPVFTGPMEDIHRNYLIKRGYDPEYLEHEWKLMGTSTQSKLGTNPYRNRILIPIMWNNQQVSWDTRAISKKGKPKYKACPLDREIIPHKNILYGNQNKWGNTGICVEGYTDVWRFGPRSFATCGIQYTNKQFLEIVKRFKRVAVCFDGGETQALKQANKLVSELKFFKVDAFRVDIDGDPGDMDQAEANYLVRNLLK